MPPPAKLKPKRSRPHARRSGEHSGPFFRTKKCPAAAFTGATRYEFSSIRRHSQTSLTKDGEASKITYLHNAAGQRVFKSEPQAAQYQPNEAVLGTDFIAWLKSNFSWLFATAQTNATLGQSYVYADSGSKLPSYALLGEYGNGGASSSGRLEYIWLPTEGGDAVPIGLLKNGNFFAVHSDHLNTPRKITDENNKLVWQWPYSAFGDNKPTGIFKATADPSNAYTQDSTTNARLQATTPPLTFNLRMPGQYFDFETGLFYNTFRSYNSGQGRYTQNDPIGLAGGLNRFGYVGGNPLRYTDPLGLNPVGGAYAGAGMGSVFGPVGTVVGGVIGFGVGAWIGWNVIGPMLQSDGSSRPPGAIDAIPGSKEWGRKNGVKNPVDIFHDIKRGNRGKPGSKASDNCSVDPNTGDVYDGQGEHIGNLGEGH